jgi:pyruvate/2-oxoglutarate dehydrogenase complex dihydrolipoamide dehydrogenase (E3) component
MFHLPKIKDPHILHAVGRKPNTDGLGLDAAGIETNKGYISVDEYFKTNFPGSLCFR